MTQRGFIFYFLMIGCTALASAQSAYIDSLETLIKRPTSDTVKVWALNELSREYFYVSPENSFALANQALDLARQIKYRRGEAYSYRILASMSAAQEHYLAYTELINKAKGLFQILNDSIGLGNCYISEAVTSNLQLNFKKSVEYYNRALEIFRSKKMSERVAVCLNNVGYVYFRMGELEKARAVLTEAIAINESIHNESVLMDSYENFGLVQYKLGKLEEAEACFNRVFELNDKLKEKANSEAYVEALIYEAQICKTQGRLEEQKELLLLAKANAEKFRYLQLMKDAFLQLSEYYIVAHDYDKAYESLTEFNVVDDSLTQKRTRDKAAMMTSVINSVQLETDFQNAQSNLEKQKLVNKQQGKTLIAVALIGILFFVMLVLLFVINRSRRAMNKTLAAHRVAMANKNRELQRLNQTKDKFFSVVAHDLRSPLNSLFGFSTLLVKHSDSMTTEEIKRMGAQLRDAVGNTLKMTENLITWARTQMQEENTKPEMIDIQKAVEETFDVLGEAASKKGIKLNEEGVNGAQAYVDNNQFRLIMRNLVNNAIKYTKAGGEIAVRAFQENGNTQIIVEDTGLGMEEDVLEKLFSLEHTVSRVGTSGERGTGLGLVMCKDFVEKNHGSLAVESEKGKGSKFIVTLPSGS